MFKDKIIYKGKFYNINTIWSIPIETEKLSEKFTDKKFVFAGRYSMLSNLYPHVFEVDNKTLPSTDQLLPVQPMLE